MIPVSIATLDTTTAHIDENWQKALAQSFKNVSDLLAHLNLNESALPYEVDHKSPFRTRVTRYFADLMNPSDPFDPLLLQVLPLKEEQKIVPGFITDPLEEADYSPTPGVIHKYKNRVLLIAHQACAIHCRYCFRRHFPYSNQSLKGSALSSALNYIANNHEVSEVILSGGDPLSLGDQSLHELLTRIDELPNISTIRLHTRTPIVEPLRITKTLVSSLRKLNSKVVMVLHSNHPNEISTLLRHQLSQLKANSILLLNQSVLLKGINDNPATLAELSNALFSAGVLPYYLHVLDPVQGTHHFNVQDKEANEIWASLQAQVSGYLLPKLVREIPKKPAKTLINK